jgi:hypothetical protein
MPSARNYQTVMDREQDADNVTREVLIAVRRTFITPFDRGNIRDLITSMDNTIDQMQKTAKSIRLFEVKTFTAEMKDMADAVLKCAELVQEGVPLLKSIGPKPPTSAISPRRFQPWKARPMKCTTRACMTFSAPAFPAETGSTSSSATRFMTISKRSLIASTTSPT